MMCAQEDISPACAVAVLERDYLNLVGRFSRILRSRILAEDLVNDAIAESLAKLRARQIADPSRLSGFVYGVAINMIKNYRRRLCNRAEVQVGSAILDTLPAFEDLTTDHDRRDLATRVREAIGALPVARDRELVRRYYLEEEDKRSICADLDLSAAHFNRVAFRARQRMRVLLEQ